LGIFHEIGRLLLPEINSLSVGVCTTLSSCCKMRTIFGVERLAVASDANASEKL